MERLDLLGVLTVGPGAQFNLISRKGGKGGNKLQKDLDQSKTQIRQCEHVHTTWGSKLSMEIQKMAETAIASSSGSYMPTEIGEGNGYGQEQEVEMHREGKQISTIAVLLQRYLKGEGRKAGKFKGRVIDDGSVGSPPLMGSQSFSSNNSATNTPVTARKGLTRRTSMMSASSRRTSLGGGGSSEHVFSFKPASRFFMSGSEWIDLIINLGLCSSSNRGKAMTCCNDLMQKGYLVLSDVSDAGGSDAGGRGSAGAGAGGLSERGLTRRGKRMSLQLSSHTPRRLRLESSNTAGSSGRLRKRSISPKRVGADSKGDRASASGSVAGSDRKSSRRATVNLSSSFFSAAGKDQASESKSTYLPIDFFQDSTTVTYVLLAPTRDDDINMSGNSQFQIATATGNTHKWRAKNTSEMKQWIVSLRNAADNAALSILTVSSDIAETQPGPVSRSGSQDTMSTLLRATGSAAKAKSKAGISEAATLDLLLAKTYVKVRVKADGPTKVLELSEEGGGDNGADEEEEDTKAAKMTSTFSQRSLTTMFGKDGTNEQVDKDALSRIRFEGELNFSLGVSVIDRPRESTNNRPREIVFLTLGDVKATTHKSLISTDLSLTVEKLQIDNQLHDCYNPTIVRARPSLGKNAPSKASKDENPAAKGGEDDDEDVQFLHIPGLKPRPLDSPPALHFFASRSFMDAKSVVFWDVVTLWLHPLDVKLEERLLFQALKLKDAVKVRNIGGARVLALTDRVESSEGMKHGAFAQSYTSTISGGSRHLIRGRMDTEAALAYGMKKKVFVNFLHLHPIDISLSFKGGGVRSRNRKNLGHVGEFAISAIGGLDDTRLKLGALQINNAFGSKSDLVDRIVKHYIFAGMKQIHVLGNVEFLGNPVGLFTNIGTGVRDFFYEPLDGLKGGDGSKSFLEGLKRGTTSLGSNFGEGTFNTMSKMTGALGEGFAHMSFDDDYKANRSAQRMREAKTASQGLRKGIFEFGESLGDAVGGVIMQPIRGMEREGGIGFVKGVAKGVVGVPVKAVVGVLDLASRATEGVKNEARSMRSYNNEYSANDEKEGRTRHPRSFGKRGELVEYDLHSAMKQKVLARVAGGKYANEHVSFDWLVKTLQAPIERKDSVFSGGDYDLQKMVSEALKDEEQGDAGLSGTSTFEGRRGANVPVEEGGAEEDEAVMWYLERSIILTNKRLLYLSEDRGEVNAASIGGGVGGAPRLEGGEESAGSSTNSLQDLLTQQAKPRLIWIVPPDAITKLRIERDGVRIMLSEAVRYHGGAGEKRFEVLQDLVPTVYDLKSQEALIFSSVCEKTLGVELASRQHLFPPSRAIDLEGPLHRSKALLGSVTELYYYSICGNVLYEYVGSSRMHSNLRMVVPLSNLSVMFNPGRDIVLKPIPPATGIPIATRSTKFDIGQAFNKLGDKIDKIKDHLRADDDSDNDEDEGGAGGALGAPGSKPLMASNRHEIVLSPHTERGIAKGAPLEEWYNALRGKNAIGSNDGEATKSVFIECNGLSSREMSSLSSSLVAELNVQKKGEGGNDAADVDIQLLRL